MLSYKSNCPIIHVATVRVLVNYVACAFPSNCCDLFLFLGHHIHHHHRHHHHHGGGGIVFFLGWMFRRRRRVAAAAAVGVAVGAGKYTQLMSTQCH